MWVFDVETLAFLEVNDAAVSHYGYSREEFLQMTTRELRPPEDVPVLLADIAESSDGYESAGIFRHRKKDGTIIYVDIARYEFVQDGRRMRLILANDVTERKQAEDKLRRSEQRYRELFENNLAAVFHASGAKLLDCNRAFCQMLGYSREEMRALDLRTLYRDLADREKGRELLYAHGKLTNYQIDLRRKDGRNITVLANLHLLSEGAREPRAVAGVMLEVTEAHRLQEQLAQSQKLEAVGKLSGGIAHDFNNILMIINSYSEIALGKTDAQSPLRGPLEQIRTASNRAASLTRQLLAFSRKQVMRPVAVQLDAVLDNLKEMLKRLIGEDISLEVSSTADLWWTKVDPSQIEQVIFNLAINARDAMPRGGRLSVRTANTELGKDFAQCHPGCSAGQYVVLTVSDTGCGIAPEIQPRIFEPFFTTKGPGIGTGLGLSTVYGIVKQSGGYISVESEPGQGATFCIYLPRTLELPAGKGTSVVGLAEAPGTTILLVEDEDPVREAIAEYLKQNDFRIIAVSSAQQALHTCDGMDPNEIDVLLTDVVMPGMSGLDLAGQFRARHPQARVVFMSGYTDDVLVRSGMRPSHAALLTKPFRLPDLVSKLKEILAQPSHLVQ
jgi:PAS domain S-box-containing protein